MSDFDQYLDHFPVGLKITIGIPVPSGDTFQDWAIIHTIDEDLLSLQLSRDTLPDGVKIHVGTIVDIRAGNEESGYACRAIIVSEGYRREILLRLIGEIVTSELREFYRIDAFLPIKYFISTEQSEVKLKAAWKEKREVRIAAEKERKQLAKKPWERQQEAPATEELPAEEQRDDGQWDDSGEGGDQEQSADDGRDHSWDDVIPLAANISGGGLRILLHHKFEENTLVPVEIYLPIEPEPQIVDAVVMVAFANENYAASKQFNRTSYNTGLKFKFIDERDRDAIVSYISNVQLKRIRQLREQYLFRGGADADQPPPINPADRMKMALKSALILSFVIVSLLIMVFYFKNYTENRPKNEIELIFEKGFGEYLKKSGRTPPPGQ